MVAHDIPEAIQPTTDRGFIIGGSTYSNDGDVGGNNGTDFSRGYWIVKLDSMGNMEWQKNYGGSKEDIAQSIDQTVDGGYIVVGDTSSDDGDISNNNGGRDYWMVKLDAFGVIEWEKNMGGSETDQPYAIEPLNTTDYIVVGASRSSNADVSSNMGGDDYWIVKLAPMAISTKRVQYLPVFEVQPNPSRGNVRVLLNRIPFPVQVRVHDLFGRCVYQQENIAEPFQIHDLQKGVYWISIRNNGGIDSKPLIVH